MTIEITDDMIDRCVEFASQASYLNHPKVAPYLGTKNGDSEKEWDRRYFRECIKYALFGDDNEQRI